MRLPFAKCPVLIGTIDNKCEGEIVLYAPQYKDGSRYVCKVQFKGAEKYNREIGGLDQLHTLECALTYLNGIRNNSKDPEFFWTNGDTMFVDQDV